MSGTYHNPRGIKGTDAYERERRRARATTREIKKIISEIAARISKTPSQRRADFVIIKGGLDS